jgi:hypothetical protein
MVESGREWLQAIAYLIVDKEVMGRLKISDGHGERTGVMLAVIASFGRLAETTRCRHEKGQCKISCPCSVSNISNV